MGGLFINPWQLLRAEEDKIKDRGLQKAIEREFEIDIHEVLSGFLAKLDVLERELEERVGGVHAHHQIQDQ